MVTKDVVYPSGEVTTDDVPIAQTGRPLIQSRDELAQCSRTLLDGMIIRAEDERPLSANGNVHVLLAMPDMRHQARCNAKR